MGSEIFEKQRLANLLATYIRSFGIGGAELSPRNAVKMCFRIDRPLIANDKAKIGSAVPLRSDQVSGPNWAWTRYRQSLDAASEPCRATSATCRADVAPVIPPGVEFGSFLKENVSPAKLRIANIGNKLHSLKQRPGQTVPQFVAYLEALEWQWPEPLQDSVRANYLTQALHDYIRKELGAVLENVEGFCIKIKNADYNSGDASRKFSAG